MTKKILIVDDTELNLELTSRILTKHGYSILAANNGQDAIHITQNQNPDVILMDLGLPDMDGWQVIDVLKSENHSKHIPIVVLTAHDTHEHRSKAEKYGCSAYITKPVEVSTLLESINSLGGNTEIDN